MGFAEKCIEALDKAIASDKTGKDIDSELNRIRSIFIDYLEKYGSTDEDGSKTPVEPSEDPTPEKPQPEPEKPATGRITLSNRVSMPLFIHVGGKVVGTWNYLGEPESNQKAIRETIVSMSLPGETPAMAFCLTPDREMGNQFGGGFPCALKDPAGLRSSVAKMVNAGIAPFATLYVDSAAPWWYDISAHTTAWKSVNDAIGDLLNGVVLAIENSERAKSRDHISQCIAVMRLLFPTVPMFGTHLQLEGRSQVNRDYAWLCCSNNTTPAGCDFVLAEYPWQPQKGDSVADAEFKERSVGIMRRSKVKICLHEFNINPKSARYAAQRAIIRGTGAWGVG